MGRSTLKEHGVLKLVHPGGLVEIHTNPITADEVMKKNPKHCVARPDVFINPWLVVRPESVLKPGSVFYIVPHHTMRKLMLKAQEKGNEVSGRNEIITDKKNQGKSISMHGNKNSRVACDNQSAIEYSSVDLTYFNSMKDMTPCSHAADKKENTFKRVHMGSCVSKSPVVSCSDLRNSCEESQVRIERNRQATKSNNCIMPTKSENSQSETALKSCLKMHTNTASDLRVRFTLPGDEEKIMRSRLWLSEINLETPWALGYTA